MCQRIYLASVQPLFPDTKPGTYCEPNHRLSLSRIVEVDPLEENETEEEPDAETSDVDEWLTRQNSLRRDVPEANNLYALDGCQCYFGYYSEEAIRNAETPDSTVRWREHLEGCNAYIPRVVNFLREKVAQTPLWIIWVWEGDERLPTASQWTVTPEHFLNPQFPMPRGKGILKIVSDGTLGAETFQITYASEPTVPSCRIQ